MILTTDNMHQYTYQPPTPWQPGVLGRCLFLITVGSFQCPRFKSLFVQKLHNDCNKTTVKLKTPNITVGLCNL